AKAAWFRDRESEYALADAVHREYMEKTAPERRLAVAADAEYRTRHPEERLEPLRSTEPEAVTDAERATFWPGEGPGAGRAAETAKDTGQREAKYRLGAGREGEALPAEPTWVREHAERSARAWEKLAQRRAVPVPSEDPDAAYEGMAWPDLLDRERDPLLRPAEIDLRPSAGVLAAAARRAEHQAEADAPEAGG